ncbi:MAG TPA: arylsulfatase [Fimbriiglobus sp.]|jgi:arylsulfatase A-like enzyme|nr:arylsulfatase [Fimbriiglobus sp.]
MLRLTLAAVLALGFTARLTAAPPNIVLILADDLGYGDLGCYGQTKIKTPHLDRLAADGVRFTTCYAGSTVCAPSRCALMCGLHTGHCLVRGNARVPLRPEDPCVAELLKKAGYATALVGKWGLGEDGSTGVPNRKGFDQFFGYLNQHHAHNSYPEWLWRNGENVKLPNVESKVENVAEKRVAYAPDLFLAEGLKFIEANRAKPFFLYYATTVPHANNERTRAEKAGNEVPSDAPYTAESWPQPEKDKAAMITRLDADVGKLLAKLTELGLDENTVVIFSSDNGPHREGGNDPEFFQSSGPFRGIKRSLTDGGIRVPGIVRWKGVTKPGTVSDHVWAFWDFLPTACELAGAKPPDGLDGISIAPTITGKGEQKEHDFLYWEFHEGGTRQAVRHKHWKAIRPAPGTPLVLYDLKADVRETKDVAADHPDVVKTIEDYLKTARAESKEFPIRAPKKK